MLKFQLDSSFTSSLPADKNLNNTPRQVFEACYSYVDPQKAPNSKMVLFSEEVGALLGLTKEELKSEEFLEVFSGTKVLDHTKPYAMCYGGHQFGHWAGQLGDGRAINLTEILHNEKRWTLQLKGSGRTPYSRTADGLAVLRSSIREFLCSEAMHYLGVPTTRALALISSGNKVLRDVLYDGNPAYEEGAIVSRVAPSFLRFGNYQIFAARQDHKNLKKLVDYTIEYFYPHLGNPSKVSYIKFFKEVTEKTLEMIIHWQRVGFVHGVMNTDNLSILGLTIDYGPYGWMDNYDPEWTPNTTDAQQKRYRYENQPHVALWNLVQLANAIYPLIEEAQPLEEILDNYKTDYQQSYLKMMKSKLGLKLEEKEDQILINDLEQLLQLTETDMTIFFRLLAHVNKENQFTELEDLEVIKDSFYHPYELSGITLNEWLSWMDKYSKRLKKEPSSEEDRKTEMDLVNPKYVLRNYMAQLAIDSAENGDYQLLLELQEMLKEPYTEQDQYQKWFAKRPDWARQKVGCSMLSCSS